MMDKGGEPVVPENIEELKLYTSEKSILKALQIGTIDEFIGVDLEKAAEIVEISRPTLFRLKYVQRELRRQKGLTTPLVRRKF